MLFGSVLYLVCVATMASLLGVRSRQLGPKGADGFDVLMLLAPFFWAPRSLRLHKAMEKVGRGVRILPEADDLIPKEESK